LNDDVDGRDKPGHDERGNVYFSASSNPSRNRLYFKMSHIPVVGQFE